MYEANALQAALVTWLSENNTSIAWHDYIEPGTYTAGSTYTYGEVGEITEIPSDTHDDDGSEVTATLHVWTSEAGMKEINDAFKEVDALHHGSLTLSGARCYKIEREFTSTRRERDPDTGGELRHGIARYRFHLEES